MIWGTHVKRLRKFPPRHRQKESKYYSISFLYTRKCYDDLILYVAKSEGPDLCLFICSPILNYSGEFPDSWDWVACDVLPSTLLSDKHMYSVIQCSSQCIFFLNVFILTPYIDYPFFTTALWRAMGMKLFPAQETTTLFGLVIPEGSH